MKKFTKNFIFSLAILGVLSILSNGCKKSSDNGNNNPPVTTVTDKDGNVYHTVTIGTQVWMVENLKTTKYNDGSSIPLVTGDSVWANMTTPGYCWMDNNAGYKTTYGALYNWYAVNTGKLSPSGWHVPTLSDLQTLQTFLGGPELAGGKLKEAGTSHWETPNTGGTNESGFTGYAGGSRQVFGPTEYVRYNTSDFDILGRDGYWWSSSTTHSGEYDYYYCIHLTYDYAGLDGITYGIEDWNHLAKYQGYSVRCIKD